MKHKAPLNLMEQLVMVLVFALAATVCLQVFVLSDRISRNCEARDRAVLAAQSAAEVLKGSAGNYGQAAQILGGTVDGQQWQLYYDEEWLHTAEDTCSYSLTAVAADSGHALLGAADITVYDREGNILLTLPVAWQEEVHE